MEQDPPPGKFRNLGWVPPTPQKKSNDVAMGNPKIRLKNPPKAQGSGLRVQLQAAVLVLQGQGARLHGEPKKKHGGTPQKNGYLPGN